MSPLLATVWAVLLPMADPVPEADDVKPGWIAGVVVLLLIAATLLLWMNMRKQLRKIRFDEPGAAEATDDAQHTGHTGAAGEDGSPSAR